ncbi:MAG: hypothetical protein A3H37_06505 [Candidatus Schekmanbacteria bacterium RIFCSPLOWO2_02_FULL_38_14]|uniref:Predicted DNA-binding protein ribbon-helix-helix domain-containing protein n=1 Tax=Candidatus Schekmanbacteria bacterium RIFCSPLOWO2_12_FULL_38_15 TaxID=1817883 RepID=A0A1F7SFU0_9BACT|nr:MAG: hypothetical protein A3H37_06505 [Candidatus Schekmanbacteria bacterium RIFCSPLOWO2_02_FULL_38_14]OGL52663.1 MAG: hypothetical protein A3G31_11955 [Candidatus Schekmanbacteria bacterium RIFCSPLOWO2_12_FULL_38_15]
MPKRKVTFFIEQEMLDELKELSSVLRVTQAAYIREGIKYVLERYRGLKKAQKEGRYPSGDEIPLNLHILRSTAQKYKKAKKGRK